MSTIPPDALARLAQMRRDRRVQWALFGLQCFGGLVVVLALVGWVRWT